MPAPSLFDYAVLRVVPYVEREEFINVGVILFCRTLRFIGAQIELDKSRLAAVAPQIDVDKVQEHLDLIPRICNGEGPIGKLSLADRFHWLVSPRSTTVQMSPVHSGFCTDPESALQHLMETMVRVAQA